MEAKVMHTQDVVKDWKFYYEEGKSFLSTCIKLTQKKGLFDNEFIYNLAVLSGERIALGLLLSYNYLPSATSLSGMLQEGKSLYQLDESLLKGARFINKFQFFCSLDVVPLTVPNDEELNQIVDYVRSIDQFAQANLNANVLELN